MSEDVRETIQATPWELWGSGVTDNEENAMLIGTAKAALTTDKTATTVNALTALERAIINVEDGTVALDVRFRGGVDGDVNVLNLYGMAGNSDSYTLMGTLTITTGTQSDGTYLFVDTITIANELWYDDIIVLSDANNGIARIAWNTQGYSKFLFIATTLGGTSIYVDYRRVG